MTGMNTSGIANFSDYDSRFVEIGVTGARYQEVMRRGEYTIKVPHSSMVRAMQNITRLGGKVASVKVVPLVASNGE